MVHRSLVSAGKDSDSKSRVVFILSSLKEPRFQGSFKRE